MILNIDLKFERNFLYYTFFNPSDCVNLRFRYVPLWKSSFYSPALSSASLWAFCWPTGKHRQRYRPKSYNNPTLKIPYITQSGKQSIIIPDKLGPTNILINKHHILRIICGKYDQQSTQIKLFYAFLTMNIPNKLRMCAFMLAANG